MTIKLPVGIPGKRRLERDSPAQNSVDHVNPAREDVQPVTTDGEELVNDKSIQWQYTAKEK